MKKCQLVSLGVIFRFCEGNLELWFQKREVEDRWLWEFPGGKIEKDEEPKIAALRELKEEVAVTANLEHTKLFKIYFTPHKIFHVFLISDQNILGELDKGGWFNLEEKREGFSTFSINYSMIEELYKVKHLLRQIWT